MGLRHGGNWGDTENKNCRSNSRRKTVASGAAFRCLLQLPLLLAVFSGISRLTYILPSAREPLQVANIMNWIEPQRPPSARVSAEMQRYPS
jgi:hypothetical protein